jgi:hypothetical protein
VLLPRDAFQRFGGGGGEDDVAWDPRVGKENREIVGVNGVLGLKIFLLHPNSFI